MTTPTDSAPLARKRDDELVIARIATYPSEPMREDPAAEILGELALDMPRQPAAVGVGVPQLGEQRLRVARNQLVQHRALG